MLKEMSRHPSTETFHLDHHHHHHRSSLSQQQQQQQQHQQQHLDPTSRSSSIRSQTDDNMDQDLRSTTNEKSHKLDLYSIPVFLLELIVLLGLAYSAYYVHFQYQHEPLISGFYCDDISYRQQFKESQFTEQFTQKHNELVIVALMFAVPIFLIIFCELVNSMFGALKFRKIRALCTCCKLHSITRRSIRFTGAYALGFFIVMISCDILANSTGRLRPYFAQECTNAYENCATTFGQHAGGLSQARDVSNLLRRPSSSPAPSMVTITTTNQQDNVLLSSPSPSFPSESPSLAPPASQPISSSTNVSSVGGAIGGGGGGGGGGAINSFVASPRDTNGGTLAPPHRRITRATVGSQSAAAAGGVNLIVERQWIDLTGKNLNSLCQFSNNNNDEDLLYKFSQIAMSWPSFPAAIFTYACLYAACYLSFVGTARPFRIITCVIVMILLLMATVFNVQLVRQHYNHWDDILASAVLASVVVLFILLVYLNRFKDTHYYENQKLSSNKQGRASSFRSYNNDVGQYEMNKLNGSPGNNSSGTNIGSQNGIEPAATSLSNNDLAMRYFQIPRANYRGSSHVQGGVNRVPILPSGN